MAVTERFARACSRHRRATIVAWIAVAYTILSTILVSTFIVLFGEFKLGVDLKGGVILVYEVNELETAQLRRGISIQRLARI